MPNFLKLTSSSKATAEPLNITHNLPCSTKLHHKSPGHGKLATYRDLSALCLLTTRFIRGGCSCSLCCLSLRTHPPLHTRSRKDQVRRRPSQLLSRLHNSATRTLLRQTFQTRFRPMNHNLQNHRQSPVKDRLWYRGAGAIQSVWLGGGSRSQQEHMDTICTQWIASQ